MLLFDVRCVSLRLRTGLAGVWGGTGGSTVLRGFLGALRGLLWGQAGFGFRQRLLDQAQDEVPLGELYAGPSRLARWVLMRWKSSSGIWNAIVLLPVMLIPPFSSFIL